MPVSALPTSSRAALPAPRLVLASGSPRRRKLLAEAGFRFDVVPPAIDEEALPGEAPEAMVERLAREKAEAVASSLAAEPTLVLGSDTVVVLEREVLGKPRDAEHAEALLARLVGRRHRVLSGVALVALPGRSVESRVVESRVTMRSATREEIRSYVATGEPLDKAGAYAVQGIGRRFVAAIEGSESNVIGLPLAETLALLRDAGLEP